MAVVSDLAYNAARNNPDLKVEDLLPPPPNEGPPVPRVLLRKK